MTILAFRGMGVNAAAVGFGQSSTCAQIAVFTGRGVAGGVPQFTCCGEVSATDDSSSGNIQNKFLSFGWHMCNTAPLGHLVGPDNDGRALPLRLSGKYIEMSVDAGTIMATSSQNSAVTFTVKERRSDGNTGSTLYSFTGQMPISAGRLSSDFSIQGVFNNINDTGVEATVAAQIYYDQRD